MLRRFVLEISETHNPGGVHAVYRAVNAFLRWYDLEVEPEHWKNPMPKVKAPRVPLEPLEPASLGDVKAMLSTCKSRTLPDLRDKAILLLLLDTGCRASEVTALSVGDVDMHTGVVMVCRGNGAKFRTVFGGKARRALSAYLRSRGSIAEKEPLFAGNTGGRLRYEALRDIVYRRARRAGVPPRACTASGARLRCSRYAMGWISTPCSG